MARDEDRHDATQIPDGPSFALIAYRLSPDGPRVVPAAPTRAWMDETPRRFAYHCVPMVIANQAGWFVLNTHRIQAVWSGDSHPRSLVVHYPDGTPTQPPVVSHFGAGIMTWRIPIVFRTPVGFDLLVRGPSNSPKLGAQPLEGLVESDWWHGTFTMNWKILAPDTPIVFEADEPICMIVPQRRHDLQSFKPCSLSIEDNPDLLADYDRWASDRRGLLLAFEPGDWHHDYIQGKGDGNIRDARRSRRRIRPFERRQ
jgi:hypothetical protein